MFPDSTLILCTHCAHLFEPSDDELGCLQCGQIVRLETYKPLFLFAAEANRYGVDYREVYQAMNDEGQGGTEAFSLAPNEIGSFLAIAALSGIVGNASYETLKRAFQKIKARMFVLRPSMAQKFDWSVVEEEEKMKHFFKLLEEFKRGMPDINERVRLMILHEMAIDYKVSQRYNAHPDSEEEQKAATQRLAEQGTLRKPPLLEEFAEFWDEMEGKSSL